MKRIYLFKSLAVLAFFVVSCGSIKSQKNVTPQECDIENEGTRKFLEEVN